MNRKLVFFLGLMLLAAGCKGGAVAFAPTPIPPDLSALRYEHPSGAFSLLVPRTWSVYEQHTATLAATAFARPGVDEPALLVAVVDLGRTLDASTLGELMLEYQTVIRPDIVRYDEQDRQAMGDGSWRLTGLRQMPGGTTQQINTFLERSGSLFAVAEVIVTDDREAQAVLQTIVNTFTVHDSASLQVTALATLSSARRTSLEILNVSSWTTAEGVFFITGEIANYGYVPVAGVPVRAVLSSADGLDIAEALDVVMGYTIPPGGFAPFSLRFGQGQPALTTGYTLSLGGTDWQPDETPAIYGVDELTWTDETTYNQNGELLINGTLTNVSEHVIRHARATVTVFDGEQHVIAAGFTDIVPDEVSPDETVSYQIVVPDTGGVPVNYIVNVQGLR